MVEQDGVRVYELTRGGKESWIAWYDPNRVVLPGDSIPQTTLKLPTGDSTVHVETLIIRARQTKPEIETRRTEKGVVTLTLTPTPIFINGVP